MKSSLQTKYNNESIPSLKSEFGYKNVMQVPKISKVTINVGYGRHLKDKAYIETVENTLKRISGQQPVHNKARKSISNFKIREGMDVGCSVTLRGERMYDFLYKLINIALPRVRDFRGLPPKAFDRQGNYSFGLKEHIAFPEVGNDSADKIHGLQVVVSTTAATKKEGQALLKSLGFPFKS